MPNMTSGAIAAGRLYVIESEQNGRALAARSVGVVLNDVPEIDGGVNAGFSYGTGLTLPARGLSIARGHFEPHGSVTPHRTRNLYVVHVIRGAGELDLFHPAGTTTHLKFQAGDTIVLPPATMHRWANGDAPFDFIGIECAGPDRAGE